MLTNNASPAASAHTLLNVDHGSLFCVRTVHVFIGLTRSFHAHSIYLEHGVHPTVLLLSVQALQALFG